MLSLVLQILAAALGVISLVLTFWKGGPGKAFDDLRKQVADHLLEDARVHADHGARLTNLERPDD